MQGDATVYQKDCGWVGVYVFPLVACRILSCTKYIKCIGEAQLGTTLTSLYIMSSVSAVFSNGDLLSICEEQLIVFTIGPF